MVEIYDVKTDNYWQIRTVMYGDSIAWPDVRLFHLHHDGSGFAAVSFYQVDQETLICTECDTELDRDWYNQALLQRLS